MVNRPYKTVTRIGGKILESSEVKFMNLAPYVFDVDHGGKIISWLSITVLKKKIHTIIAEKSDPTCRENDFKWNERHQMEPICSTKIDMEPICSTWRRRVKNLPVMLLWRVALWVSDLVQRLAVKTWRARRHTTRDSWDTYCPRHSLSDASTLNITEKYYRFWSFVIMTSLYRILCEFSTFISVHQAYQSIYFRFSYTRISLYFFSRTVVGSPNLISASWPGAKMCCWEFLTSVSDDSLPSYKV